MTDEYASLPAIALDAIAHALRTGERRLPDVKELAPALARPGATFVTLERDGRLLGCIGTLRADRPLGISVAHCALGSAFDDPRLPPLTRDDYCVMYVKVSVLSEPAPVAAHSLAELAAVLEPRVDGVIVTRRGKQATFLPSVWEQLPGPDTFLAALWQKAGLPPGMWDAHVRVSTYTTVEIGDDGPRQQVESSALDG